jgi:hypothetical protein
VYHEPGERGHTTQCWDHVRSALSESAFYVAQLLRQCHEACSQRGFPSDDEVFPNSSTRIVRHGDLLNDDLLIPDLPCDTCHSSLRNVCKADLAHESQELARQQDRLHTGLCRLADMVGKDRANRCEELFMFVSESPPRQHLFAILCKAIYNPKVHVVFCRGSRQKFLSLACSLVLRLEHSSSSVKGCSLVVCLRFSLGVVGSWSRSLAGPSRFPSFVCQASLGVACKTRWQRHNISRLRFGAYVNLKHPCRICQSTIHPDLHSS